MPQKLGKSNLFARAAVVTLACATIAAASGCGGSSEQFTSGEADRALAALDAIQDNVDEGRCAAARSRVNVLAVQSTHVSGDRSELGEAYASSVARLNTLVGRECVEITPESPTPETAATGSTGSDAPKPPAEPTSGGKDKPAKPDDGGQGEGNDGDKGGDQAPGEDKTPPENSGGAGPGT